CAHPSIVTYAAPAEVADPPTGRLWRWARPPGRSALQPGGQLAAVDDVQPAGGTGHRDVEVAGPAGPDLGGFDEHDDVELQALARHRGEHGHRGGEDVAAGCLELRGQAGGEELAGGGDAVAGGDDGELAVAQCRVLGHDDVHEVARLHQPREP